MMKKRDNRRPSQWPSAWPSAWELWVSLPDRNQGWVRYAIYETYKQAEAALKRVEGPPLELKIVPLYAVEETE